MVLLGGASECFDSLRNDGYSVRLDSERRVRLIATVVTEPLDIMAARSMRLCLATRGSVYVACPVSLLVSTWTVLRTAGLEPKKTVVFHPSEEACATDVVVVARPGKRGGLIVEVATSFAKRTDARSLPQ